MPSTSVAPKATARASGKSKAKPVTRVTAPPENSPKTVSKKPGGESSGKKVIKKSKSNSVPKPSVPSAASQPPAKRHRGKSPAEPPHASEETEIEKLKKVGFNWVDRLGNQDPLLGDVTLRH